MQNGCLQVLKGSHKLGRLNHDRIGTQTGVETDRLKLLEPHFEKVHCTMTPGTVLFFHGNTLHASSANESDKHRRSFIMCYNALGNPQLGEKQTSMHVPVPTGADDAILRFASSANLNGVRFWILDCGFWIEDRSPTTGGETFQSKIQNRKSKIPLQVFHPPLVLLDQLRIELIAARQIGPAEDRRFDAALHHLGRRFDDHAVGDVRVDHRARRRDGNIKAFHQVIGVAVRVFVVDAEVGVLEHMLLVRMPDVVIERQLVRQSLDEIAMIFAPRFLASSAASMVVGFMPML